MKLFLLCFWFLCVVNEIHCNGEFVATTKLGDIQGSQMFSFAGRTFLAFRGIPYAKPPIGLLRFQDPQPVDPWKTLLNGTKEGPNCVQYEFTTETVIGTEDCLVVNIYTHNLDSNSLRPVMIWIHGGGFIKGSGNGESHLFGPRYFMDRDIVLVTINYRLGPLGFLTTEDTEAPGNYGLLDQTMALKWVQDHIDRFGGNPDSVTIFGESAGGTSVHFHLLSQYSKGLFHRAIAQSGTTNCFWSLSNTVGESSKQLAHHFQCPTTSKEMIDCLRQLKAEDIADYQRRLKKPGRVPRIFVPRIDIERPLPFVPRTPREIIESGQFNRVPFIAGMNQNEGSFVFRMLLKNGGKELKSVEENLLEFVIDNLGFYKESGGHLLGQRAIREYLQLGKPLREQLPQLEQMISDFQYFKGIDESVRLNVKYSSQPTYFYWYAHQQQVKLNPVSDSDIETGVSHGDELLLMFSSETKPVTSVEDLKVSKIFIDLWTSFAIQGKPSSGLSETWLPSTEKQPRYLNIQSAPRMVNGEYPFKHRLAIWQCIMQEIHPQVNFEGS